MRIVLISLPLLVSSCTLSFQNIDTHGMTSDLVDENQSTTPNFSVPVSALPN